MEKEKINSYQANKIPITDYLLKRGYSPIRENETKAYFKSLSSKSKSSYLYVDKNTNKWFDYGSRGSIIDLCLIIDKATNVKEALNLLSEFNQNHNSKSIFSEKQLSNKNEITIKHIQPIQNMALIQYLISRKINISIATKYINELYYLYNDRNYFAICFKNDKGGYELRSKPNGEKEGFKGSTSPKYYTTIKGKKTDSLNIFEGFFDFLSALTYYKTNTPGNDTIILNSLAFVDKIYSILPNYTTLNLFLDNDEAGKKAAQTILEHHTKAKNQSLILFPTCKDFNEFICSK